MRKKICAIGMLLGGLHYTASGAGIPREIALENLPTNIKAVHEHMNDDPDLINKLLVVQMAVPIGDRPEVLSALDDVIKHSTNPASVEEATNALHLCVRRHKWQIKKSRYPEIAALLQLGLKQTKGLGTKLEVADSLSTLGAEYKEAAYRIHLDILANPGELTDTNWGLFLRAIKEVVDTHEPGAKEAARQAVGKFKVRDYVLDQIEKSKGQPVEAVYRKNMKFLDTLNPEKTETDKKK